MKKHRYLSALALLLLIAPAIPVAASLCGVRPCPMMEAEMDCMHMPTFQETRQESHEMECCQKDGASISSLEHGEHGVGECCSVSSQDSPEAIPQTRIASPDPLQISSPCEDVSAQTVAIERDFEAIQEKPRPATALFTLHSAFLI